MDLLDGKLGALLLFNELALVCALEEVGVDRCGDDADDVECKDDTVCAGERERSVRATVRNRGLKYRDARPR